MSAWMLAVVSWPSLAVAQDTVQVPSIRVHVIDAVTRERIPRARVACGGAAGETDSSGVAALRCHAPDSLDVRRLGYHAIRFPCPEPQVNSLSDTTLQLIVPLVPVGRSLASVTVYAPSSTRVRDSMSIGAAFARGAFTTAATLNTLPFVIARPDRGGNSLSMRGSRPEQVAVLLDGVPLNDPATGRAEVGTIPLVFLSGIAATPGANADVNALGSSGGVIALRTADRSQVSIQRGSYGEQSVGGLLHLSTPVPVRVGASASRVRNDYPFLNQDGATGSDSLERRTNEDRSAMSALCAVDGTHAQLLALGESSEYGLAGPANVHAFDATRGRSRQLAVRARTQLHDALLTLSTRAFALDYLDRVHSDLDSYARSVSTDLSVQQDTRVGLLSLSTGRDVTTATTITRQARGRAFAQLERSGQSHDVVFTLDGRADWIEGAGVMPTATIAATRAGGRLRPYARFGTSFRPPTLDDLYFSSPQRVQFRPLVPERVTADAELGARYVSPVTIGVSAFARRTHDAIVWFPGNFLWSPRNVGLEGVTGVETRASYEQRRFSISSWAGYTTTTLHAGTVTVPTPYVPNFTGGMAAAFRTPWFTVAPVVHGISARPTVAAPVSASTQLPPVTLVDVAIGNGITSWGHQLQWTVAVRDVGDVQWQPVARYPTPGRTIGVGVLGTL